MEKINNTAYKKSHNNHEKLLNSHKIQYLKVRKVRNKMTNESEKPVFLKFVRFVWFFFTTHRFFVTYLADNYLHWYLCAWVNVVITIVRFLYLVRRWRAHKYPTELPRLLQLSLSSFSLFRTYVCRHTCFSSDHLIKSGSIKLISCYFSLNQFTYATGLLDFSTSPECPLACI